MRSFKVDNMSFEEAENDGIDLYLTLAEQGLMPAKYIINSGRMPKPIQELLDVDEDFSYLHRFYLMNMKTLRRELMYNVNHFMSLIKGRYYTDKKKMPDLFPYIGEYTAINLLRTDPDFFLKHLNQFFANEDIRTDIDYADLYAILSNKETSVEQKIERIELL